MAALVEDILQEACEAVFEQDDALARRVVARDEDVDREEVKVESEVIRLLALYQPVGSDLRWLCAILKINSDLERVADCAVNIAERASHMSPEFVRTHESDIMQLATLVRQHLRNAIRAYASEDAEAAKALRTRDDVVDALYAQFIRAVVGQTAQGPGGLAAFLDVLSVAKNLERIADHATNIAEDVIFLTTGQIVRHSNGNAEPKP